MAVIVRSRPRTSKRRGSRGFLEKAGGNEPSQPVLGVRLDGHPGRGAVLVQLSHDIRGGLRAERRRGKVPLDAADRLWRAPPRPGSLTLVERRRRPSDAPAAHTAAPVLLAPRSS